LEPSLVLAGVQSEDLGFGQVGIWLAKKLGIPHVSSVTDIQVSSDLKTANVTKEMAAGSVASVAVSLPCLLTIQTSARVPRYPTMLNQIRAKRTPIEMVQAPHVELSGANAPLVQEFFLPKRSSQVEIIQGDPETAAQKLVEKLAEGGLL
jgi:electron transfer flavoprotein beta subunit